MTLEQIKQASKASGAHWFDRETMEHFATRISRGRHGKAVYEGEGGVFFVTSEKPLHGGRGYSVRQFFPENGAITTVGEFCTLTRDAAHDKADLYSKAGTIQLTGGIEETAQALSTEHVRAMDDALDGDPGEAGEAAMAEQMSTKHHEPYWKISKLQKSDEWDVSDDVHVLKCQTAELAILFAAAPDLLEACKATLDILSGGFQVDGGGRIDFSDGPMLQKLQAAIAKAEGAE